MATENTDANDDFAVPMSTDNTPEGLQEQVAVKALVKQYKTGRQLDNQARTQYSIDRNMSSGNDSKQWASSANLIGAFIDILVSFLYAKDPDVTATAGKVVGDTPQDNVDFADTASIVVGKLWKKGRLKKAARKMVRSSLSVGPGWLKVIMTHETRKDPEIEAQLNDLEDNVQRLEATQKVLQEGELDEDEVIVKLKEAEQLKISLSAKLEVVHRRGLGIDFVEAENMQVSGDVSYLSDHLDANWNANEIYIQQDEVRGRFKRLTADDVKQAATFHQRKKQQRDVQEGALQPHGRELNRRYKRADSSDGTEVPFVRVVELWDKRDNHIKTFIDGVGRWAVEPYTPPYASTRFYPYFNLSLFEVDGERHPQSLSDRLKQLQEEYSSKRSNSRLAAQRAVPGVMFNAQGISPEDVRKIEGAVAQEFIGINPTTGDDIRKLFTEKPIGNADPRIYDTGAVLADMERISGVQEAQSGAVTTAKTATEAKIQDTGFASRTGADRDTVEDLLQDLSEYTLELAVQALSAAEVMRLAGEKAFWPEGMDIEDLLTLAELEIEAGSTGKPNQGELRQSWSVLLPLVQQIMVAIQEAQFMGNLPLAEAMKNLLRETMRRLDERINIDQFIPAGELPNLAGVPGVPGGNAPEQPQQPPGNAADANTLV